MVNSGGIVIGDHERIMDVINEGSQSENFEVLTIHQVSEKGYFRECEIVIDGFIPTIILKPTKNEIEIIRIIADLDEKQICSYEAFFKDDELGESIIPYGAVRHEISANLNQIHKNIYENSIFKVNKNL